jgi:hypothetical protein
MSFARGSTCQVILPQEMARVIASGSTSFTATKKTPYVHQAPQQPWGPHATNPREQKRRATEHATQGERKRGEKSQQQRPRVTGHATTTEQRTTINLLSGSLESDPCHNVLASGGLTFQVRSCPHSALDSKVLKKHSVDPQQYEETSAQPDETKILRRHPRSRSVDAPLSNLSLRPRQVRHGKARGSIKLQCKKGRKAQRKSTQWQQASALRDKQGAGQSTLNSQTSLFAYDN